MYSIVRFVQKSSRLRISSLRSIKVEEGWGGGGGGNCNYLYVGASVHRFN